MPNQQKPVNVGMAGAGLSLSSNTLAPDHINIPVLVMAVLLCTTSYAQSRGSPTHSCCWKLRLNYVQKHEAVKSTSFKLPGPT